MFEHKSYFSFRILKILRLSDSCRFGPDYPFLVIDVFTILDVVRQFFFIL